MYVGCIDLELGEELYELQRACIDELNSSEEADTGTDTEPFKKVLVKEDVS